MSISTQNFQLASGVHLVLFSFTRGEKTQPPTDQRIQEFANTMGLTHVFEKDVQQLMQEFPQFRQPKNRVIFFNAHGRGDPGQGDFPGHHILNTLGEISVLMDWTRPSDGSWDWNDHFMMRSAEPLPDWTADTKGVSNSSEAYFDIVGAVEKIILDSGHDIVRGRANTVARTIVSKLAHEFKLAPPTKTSN